MENHTYDEESKPYHSLTEMMAFTKPKGLENYRFYRIEYGGHAMDCVYEGAIWLPENVDREEIEKLINTERDDEIVSFKDEIKWKDEALKRIYAMAWKIDAESNNRLRDISKKIASIAREACQIADAMIVEKEEVSSENNSNDQKVSR